MEGAELIITDDALHAIARKAILRKTGARGLRSILEASLLDTMYDLPSHDNIKQVTLNAAVIEDEAAPALVYGEPKSANASGEVSSEPNEPVAVSTRKKVRDAAA